MQDVPQTVSHKDQHSVKRIGKVGKIFVTNWSVNIRSRNQFG